ncbi:MAG: hypothetical protein QF715_16995 [Pseudomonadales bacterium]|jgi:hypothetical protein|nr:hypothetical protein [Gammaproteobacteria bacterium]MDP6027251.1 hypothetical protein [Pseudomonadales bacterium]MDP6316468.1 hypothetical protein [Pseudomonadales bacterium]MDP7316475.1 hypothetical protein [Pseudomonadales bacterium]|tara:strand:+ start:4695 stop:5222 length:528 start_codon:yes stop_codon:yes gene_type:complete
MKHEMSSAINQMQMLYNPEEDRILFRVNTTDNKEFRFWVTRRYTFLLMKVLKEHLEADPDVSMQGSPDAKQAVKNFKQEKAIQESNFGQKFKDDPNELPMGDDIPLAFKLTYNMREDKLHLGIQPRTGQGINLVIDRQINTSMVQLIISATQKADWTMGDLTGVAIPVQDDRVVN